MDVFKNHGAFSWSELMTTDPASASAFYGALFGWTVETMDMGSGPYHVVKVGDTAVGGIMKTPPDTGPMPPAWCVYVTVSDVDAAVAKAQELGGKVCAPVMTVPRVGRMAVLADPQGAVFNVMQYDPV
jgi:hypothetical protein